MRSSSIGSPLLSIIQRAASLSSAPALRSSMTPQVLRVLSRLAPRLSREVIQPESVCSVTVFGFSYPGTSGDFLAKTTYSTMVGKVLKPAATEFCWSAGFPLLDLLQGFPCKEVRNTDPKTGRPGDIAGLSFRVWTSPGIIQQAPRRKLGPSSGGLPLVQFSG